MHKLLRLCTPDFDEVLFYLCLGFFALFVLNIPGLYRLLLNSSHTDPQTAQSIGTTIKQAINRSTSLSDPQIVNAFVWSFTAAIALLLVVGVTDFIQAEKEDRQIIHERNGAYTFLARLGLRLAALLGLAAYGAMFFGILLPNFLSVFLSAVAHPTESWSSIPRALATVVATAASLYLFAIMARLLLLRVRVFAPYID